MKKVFRIIMLAMTGLLSAALFVACGDVESEFSTAPCALYFDNQTHNDFTLADAMTPLLGIFVTITTTSKSGAQYFVFTNNQGHSSQVVFDAKDKQRQQAGQLILGLNGAIIVGYGFSETFYAYDRECPNCFDSNALPLRSYPLKVNSAGIASCSHCHRTYDLNNGGIIASGNGGKKMTRFHAATTGANGLLCVR
jgi:hypothetical protein